VQKIIVANWKMHKTIRESEEFIEALKPVVKDANVTVMLSVPFTAISQAVKSAQGANILIGAQNLDYHPEGPYTGEISARMLKEAGAHFVIVGHSERRRLFYESSEIVNLKLKAAMSCSLQPLLCIGETQEERQSGQVDSALKIQLGLSLFGISAIQLSSIMVAYEPMWAIGTNLVPSKENLFAAHRLCRRLIAESWGINAADRVPILYGGSVNGDNAGELLGVQGVNGLLVGGASLSVESFSKIIRSQQTLNYS
jgi:triosephosphate isomerase